MNLFCVLFALVSFIILGANGGLLFERHTKDKYNPGMCYSTVLNQSIKMGKAYPTPNCGEMICDKNYVISYAGCISAEIPENCKETEETRTRPYPDCCPSSYCYENVKENLEEGSLII